jgi:two-component system cell cycle sensor histidine kinase/response regulator CckA
MQTENRHEYSAPSRVGKRASVQTEILVVEDEAIVAEDIRTTLQGMGYSVPRTAASGEEAVRTASENAPALALLDIRLQGHIDGIGAAEQLRALGVPVVFLTSYSDEPTLQRARAAQPFGYLLKPFDERELRATIEMALYKHGMDVKLADRERWFSTTLQSIGDGVVAADSSQRVSFMNQAAEILSGWKGRDAVGLPLDDVLRIVDARTGQAQPPPGERALRERVVVGLPPNTALLTKSGLSVEIDDSTAPIVDGRGDALGVVVVFRDATRERKAERALRESEACFRATFDSSPLPKWVCEVDSLRILAVNQAAIEQYGYPLEQFLGMTLDAVGPGVGTSGRSTMRFGRHHKSDGTLIDVQVWSNDLTFEGRRARLVTAHDVTERLALQRKVLDARERYRALFNESPWPSWMVDPETMRFLEVNDAAIALYGYSREQFLAMEVSALSDGEPELVRKLAAQNAAMYVGMSRHRCQNGTTLEVDLAGNYIQSGDRKEVLVLARDVTEQRRVEEQLRQAQKLEALGRLAGGVAHDFNNLLAVILNYSSLLLSRPKKSKAVRGEIEEIQAAAQRAAELTRQLLAFTRQPTFQAIVVDINEVLREFRPMLSRMLGEDVEIHMALDPTLGGVLSDRTHIEQVIMNLVINSRDAMSAGGCLSIETSNVLLDAAYAAKHSDVMAGPYVMLTVGDTGAGMDLVTRTRIFEPFFTTKGFGKGTGLGLSTVFGIVGQSGGHIQVSSEPGKGTTFRVYFPSAEDVVGQTTSDARRSRSSATRGSETVLLVEDERRLRAAVAAVLRRWGYRVLEAADADAALLACRDTDVEIHLVLSDVVLPRTSGPELVEKLRLLRPEAKVLLMSGYLGRGVGERGFVEPGTPFLQKPFTQNALAVKVREVLGRPWLQKA